MHYLQGDAELDRIMALVESPNCPLPVQALWSAGPYVDGAEICTNLALVVVPASWQTPEDHDHLAFAQKLRQARAFLEPATPGTTIRWLPSMEPLMFRGDYARARKFWSKDDPDVLRRSVDEEPIGGIGLVAGDLDFIVPPDVWQFDPQSYELLEELLEDNTLHLERVPEAAVTLMSTGRQRSLLEDSRLLNRFRETPDVILKALSFCWFRTPPLGRQESFWFEPKRVISSDGTVRVQYGTLSVKRLLLDLAEGRLRTWVGFPASVGAERMLHVFSRMDPDDSGNLMKLRDRLLDLDTI